MTIIAALALYDLSVGDPTVRPTAENGYLAAQATTRSQQVRGRVAPGPKTT